MKSVRTGPGDPLRPAAVKLARGHTGRKKIVIPAEHPFFSYDDWFIGSTPADHGIPEEVRQFTLRFKYNDLASLERVFDAGGIGGNKRVFGHKNVARPGGRMIS